MLSDDELHETWARYVADRDVDDLDLLTRQYMPLARFFARRALAKAPPHQDSEDILAYAHDGLIRAIMAFDPGMNVKFETYATRRIPGAIIDGQRRDDPLARTARRRVKVLQAATEALWERLQRDPDVHEIANEAEMDVDTVRATLLASKTLNAQLSDGEGDPSLAMGSEAELHLHLSEARLRVAEKLAELGVRERAFVLWHYCDGLSMKETAKTLGISGDWCRQTRHQVLDLLKS